jgi:hypothetical protein
LQIGFPVLQASRLARFQGAVLHAIGDALLLAAFASVNLVDPWMSRIDYARPGACVLLRGGGTGQHQSPNRKDN